VPLVDECVAPSAVYLDEKSRPLIYRKDRKFKAIRSIARHDIVAVGFMSYLYNIIVSSVEYWSRGGDYVRAGTLLSLACLHALIYLHACILAYGFYSFYAFYAFYGPLLDLQAYPAG
jgi:hypothetical protein